MIDSTLGVTGAIYAIRRCLFEPIPDDTILDDIEIPLRAFKKGYRVTFEDRAIATDTASTELEAEFKRKARTLAGNYQLFAHNPWLLNPLKNRIFLQSISHKLFRLLVPYCLVILFFTTYYLEALVFKFLFWGQVTFYASGLAALLFKKLRKSRIINFIVVFISLNSAAVYGLYSYVTGRSVVRWKK
jgi:cellulose synthase/poly-beta-1,6-N-acetylglucosamine synthase-like glycosyltransferase